MCGSVLPFCFKIILVSAYQVGENKQKNGLPTYTSLEEEQQVTTIMRSVSMDGDHRDRVGGSTEGFSSETDLFVKVNSPEKHVEGYVSYCVTTQVLLFTFLHFIWQKLPQKCLRRIICTTCLSKDLYGPD